ncbi:unnamed protein product [Rangifer tarandus platyrhynchus]|uniref:Uncharacterized protein n=1 Tax=Rangifer tarandus platyrhynchus TaxID=3082113 RepID=A0ABN8ZCF2_RANTA|nr:unnamed protein product [Rangifer tarandus platyrhynchus]
MYFHDIKYHECAIWLGYTKHKGEVWGQKGRTSPRVRGDGAVKGSSGMMKCSKIDCGDASATLCCCILARSCPTLCEPMDCSLPGSLPSMEFSRQEYWSGLPFLPPVDLPDPGIKSSSPASPALQADSFPLSFPSGKPNSPFCD